MCNSRPIPTVFSCFALVLVSTVCVSASDSALTQASKKTMSADLEPFLKSYFATWSVGDIEGYRDHFHDRASIATITEGILTLSMSRDEFVAFQERALEGRTLTERMTSFTVDEDDVAAAVTAQWVLDDGTKKATGIDRFTLIRDRLGNWKIVSLLFYTR